MGYEVLAVLMRCNFNNMLKRSEFQKGAQLRDYTNEPWRRIKNILA